MSHKNYELNDHIKGQLNHSFEEWNISDDTLSESNSLIGSVRVENTSSKMVNSVLGCNRRHRTSLMKSQKVITLETNSIFTKRIPKKNKFKTSCQHQDDCSVSSFNSSLIENQQEKPKSLKGEISLLLKQIVQNKKSEALHSSKRGIPSFSDMQKDKWNEDEEYLVTVRDLINPNYKF